MQERLEFVREYESGLFTMTELAAQYGVSRREPAGHGRGAGRCAAGGAAAASPLGSEEIARRGPAARRLSRLSVWWLRLGIGLERIAPGHPEQDGSHEQFHRVLKAETARPPAPHCAAQQQRFRRFVREYNEDRPHEALRDQPPASCYAPSRRALPARLPPLAYPGHTEKRLVSSNGCISWNGAPVFIATPLAGEYVAFEEVDDGLWTLWFATAALARYDDRSRTLHPLAAPCSRGRFASGAGSAPALTNEKNNG